ncbi:MAG: cation:proton antiporter [Phycisphaerae bacterium]
MFNSEQFSIVLTMGIAIFGGLVGARFIRKFRVPKVVGYVATGLVLGPVLKLIPYQTVELLEPFNVFALGVIGFLVGGELKREIFARFGKQVPIVLLFEGVTAALLVGILSFLVMWYFASWQIALAVAVVFGAICSATDPASTIAVLWEYKARGPLTSMLTAIVTLDDALALTLYAVSVSIAGVATGLQTESFITSIYNVLFEILGAVLLGLAGGLGTSWILKRLGDPEKFLIFTVSALMLVIGLASFVKIDVILACMTLGLTLTNIKSKKTASSFGVMHRFFAPMYVLFFVLVGARVNFSHFDLTIALLIAAYVGGSIIGKTLGSYLGGVFSGAAKTVRNYLGFCLYPQGGIAVGLLIMASHKFSDEIGSIMLLVVVTGAFILQIIGPIGVKFGAVRAGEIGLNVTEEDLIKKYKVSDVMDVTVPVISTDMSLSDVIKIFGESHCCGYPVIDTDKKLAGVVTLEDIRNTFANQELNDWLVALDIAEPITESLTPEMRLPEAIEKTKTLGVEFLPVTASGDSSKYVGILDIRIVHRKIAAEALAKQKEADAKYGLGVS